MNLGIARLAIIAALVVGGIAVLANGFSDQDVNAAPPSSPSPSASQTQSPSPQPQQNIVPNKKGVLVQVFNGTNTAGLAGDMEQLLEAEGYLKAGEPADAPDKPILDSIVYFRADDNRAQNRADAKLLAKDYLGGAPVDPLPAAYDSITSESADVIVVMGEDQAGV
jgi:LytR cell envelope-related transcriptional attenuator